MTSKCISSKQREANIQNSKFGGVKTREGKETSSKNAIKHGVLSHSVMVGEEIEFNALLEHLEEELNPASTFQRICIERIAVHILQLNRLAFAKNEFLLATLNPGLVIDRCDLSGMFKDVVDEPYSPLISADSIERLLSIYHRYEVSTENRLYRAMKEFNLRN